MTPSKRPTAINLRNVRPGGGRKKHTHALSALPADPPSWLPPEAAALYREVAKSVAHGHLAGIDAPLLATFAAHVSIHRRAVTELAARKDMTVETSDTTKVHPLVTIVADQAKVLIDLAAALCLTPLSRAKLKLPAAPVASGWDNIAD